MDSLPALGSLCMNCLGTIASYHLFLLEGIPFNNHVFTILNKSCRRAPFKYPKSSFKLAEDNKILYKTEQSLTSTFFLIVQF